MAIAHDNSTSGHASSAATCTVSKTNTGTETGGVLLVFVSIGTSATNISGTHIRCQYAGYPMFDVLTQSTSPMAGVDVTQPPNSTSSGQVLFYLLNPPAGTFDIVVDTQGTMGHIVVGASSYTGVYAVNGATQAGSNVQANSNTLTVTSQAGDLVWGGGAHGDNTTGLGTGGTQRFQDNFSTSTSGGCIVGGEEAGAASVSFDCTSAISDHWNLIAVNLAATDPGTPSDIYTARFAASLRATFDTDTANNGTVTIPNLRWSSGDRIVIMSLCRDMTSTAPVLTPTNSNLTFTHEGGIETAAAAEPGVFIHTATAGSSQSAQTITITMTNAGASNRKIGALVWVISAGTGYSVSGYANVDADRAESTITKTVSAHSLVLYGCGYIQSTYTDKAPVTGSGSRTERDEFHVFGANDFGWMAAEWAGVSAGSTAFGMDTYTSTTVAQGIIEVTATTVAVATPVLRSPITSTVRLG